MDYIYLQGSEDVKSAGHNMQSAAGAMQSAANTISTALYEHKQFLEEFITRFEEAINKKLDKA